MEAHGPDIRCNAKTTLALGMAIHELATNANKYGGLSRSGGSVRVEAVREGDEAVLVWKERGGPDVVAPQGTAEGFGTFLLRNVLAGDVGGSVDMDFRGEGLVCTIRFEVGGS